uniref:Uncharacterized protein n=1 Tax=Arundo donax TaxID=35708 RepID=A0A0A9BNY0_ARUDO
MAPWVARVTNIRPQPEMLLDP